MSEYDFYNIFGRSERAFDFYEFVNRNPEFDNSEFREWVISKNRGCRDGGELGNVAAHEILRLAYTFAEHRWRASNVYGEENEGLPKGDNQ